EPDASGEEEGEDLRLADDDQRAVARADDVIDPLAELGARRYALERGEQLRIAPRIVLGRRAREAERRSAPLLPSRCLLLLQHRAPRGWLASTSPPAARAVCHARVCLQERRLRRGRASRIPQGAARSAPQAADGR